MNKKQKRSLTLIIISAALLAIAAAVSEIFSPGLFSIALFAVPYMIVGYDVLWSALRNVFHGQVFDEQFLMSLATLGAFAIGEYPEAVFVMLFYQVGELFQSIAVGKSRRSIAALMEICPDRAVVLRDGVEIEVAPDEVSVGETIIVRAGERIPLDGVITSGSTSVDTAALTGESVPVERGEGDRAFSGTVNLTGLIRVRVDSAFSESTVSKIMALIEDASEKKTKYENFITRFARYYTPSVVIAAVLLAVLPPIFDGAWLLWLERALTFLVISCPCALVVSVPVSFFCGIGTASRHGILIKGSNYIEALSRVDTFVFDKTGTLTKGRFRVESVVPHGISESKLLSVAAAAESYSNHPIAAAIVEADLNNSLCATTCEELSGFGIKALIGEKTYFVGNSRLMKDIGITFDAEAIGTVVYVASEGEYLGYITVADEIKPDAADSLAKLKNMGIMKTVMLTGDGAAAATAVAASVGADEVRAKLLPIDKVAEVEKLIDGGRRTAFVGDGINDAPVLARATVGIAMGALGSDAAIESADVVLMDDKLSKLPMAVSLARKTMRIVKENIWFILITKAVILILGALGVANMWAATFGDVGVMVIAVLNAMRVMKIR
ncbi:MAG: cadmium-translocating P-type ATPase [Ruminococcaceae bacterium]|nr:cadmium-translocating P-type ATPase [Oscillospiraceae bacterium]